MEKQLVFETEQYRYYLRNEDESAPGAFFVNHQKNNRSGHFGHAMVECPNGDILAFYPNCNTDNGGHSGRGWMEFKRSADGGETWTEGKPFPYSKQLWDLGLGISSINEKAITADDGTILLFNLICDVTANALWEPYFAPTVIASRDNGESWESARRFTMNLRGRTYDVIKRNGTIFILFKGGWNGPGKDVFKLFCSIDNGKTIFPRSNLPFLESRYYGNLEFLSDGKLIAYTYCEDNEYYIEYCVSEDEGKSWSEVRTTYFANRIRNPQVIRLHDAYFAFGRSGSFGEDQGHIIMYASHDGLHWGDGIIIARRGAGVCAYSNAILVRGEKILYQSSHSYYLNQTNIRHWFIEPEKK